jgi:hypothetical protein
MSDMFSNSFWIHASDEAYQSVGRLPTEIVYFRRTFSVGSEHSLKVHISASTRYKLYVNGNYVINGPCRGDNITQYYDTLELGDYLVQGENIIAIKVISYPPREARTEKYFGPIWAMSNAAGACLLVEGFITDSSGNNVEDISTGRSKWLAHVDNSTDWRFFMHTEWIGSMEIVDGSKNPHGWINAKNPKGNWLEAAIKLTAESRDKVFGAFPVFPLHERPIPYMYLEEKDFVGTMPLRDSDNYEIIFENGKALLKPTTKYTLELNAGALTCGYFRIRVSGGSGAKIVIVYAECYAEENPGKIYLKKGIRDDWQNYRILGHEDVYYPSGGVDIYEPFWLRTFRFIRIEIETSDDQMTLYMPNYIETGYPLEEKSWIRTDQEWTGKIWEISKRTLKLCMFETYMDCPYYEQLQYIMDTRTQILFTYMLSGDTRLAKRTISDFNASVMSMGLMQARYPSEYPHIIPGFSLYWICMLEDYYWQTGDISILKRYRSVIDGILDWFDRKTGDLGLVENLGYWELVDWVIEWSHLQGVPAATLEGPSTIQNLHYVYGLQVAARINRLVGRPGLANEYETRAENLSRLAEKLCWSESIGMYREGPSYEEYTQHAQIWAVLTGLAKGEKATKIMAKAITEPDVLQCSFAMQFYLFRALDEAKLYHETEDLWQIWKELLDLRLTTIFEAPAMPRSDCHAWGALPLYEFTTRFLGVRPLAPGWEEILIEPKAFFIKEIQGVVHTPKGDVMIQCQTKEEKLILSGEAPNVSVLIRLPGVEKKLENGGIFNLTADLNLP